MSYLLKKSIAILLLIWLPLFTGNALAASIRMQMPHPGCDRMQQMPDDCDQMVSKNQADDQQESACSDCGLCQLACSAYLSMPEITTPGLPDVSVNATPYLLLFQSVSAIPLLPPPLSRV